MYIFDRFNIIRKHFGLSQVQFATKINKSPSFISNVETGKSEISESTVNTVCSVFGINKSWLASGTGEMFAEGHSVAEADKETVGARIKEVRKREKLTQEQFGKAIGYSKMQIYYVEVGKVTPSNDFLRSASDTFNVSYEWLLTGEGEIKRSEKAIVNDKLIEWLENHPEVVKELLIRSGLD